MNTWEPLSTDSSAALEAGSWSLLLTTFAVPDSVLHGGGDIVFPELGLARECWHNGARCEWQAVDDGRRRQIKIPPGEVEHQIVLVLHAPAPHSAILQLPFPPTLTPTTPKAANRRRRRRSVHP